jgi:hypothetical protein
MLVLVGAWDEDGVGGSVQTCIKDAHASKFSPALVTDLDTAQIIKDHYFFRLCKFQKMRLSAVAAVFLASVALAVPVQEDAGLVCRPDHLRDFSTEAQTNSMS